MHVRRAVVDDVFALHVIYNSAYGIETEELGIAHPVLPCFGFAIDFGLVFVSELDGELVGFISAIPWRGGYFLNMFYVAEVHQGSGVGASLCSTLERAICGHPMFTLSTDSRSAHARYLAFGMTPYWTGYELHGTRESFVRSLRRPQTDTASGVSVVETCLDRFFEVESRMLGLVRCDWSRYVREILLARCFVLNIGGVDSFLFCVFRRNDWATHDLESVTLGPVVALVDRPLVECLIPAFNVAFGFGERVRIFCPAPSGILPDALDLGFRVADLETFFCTDWSPLPCLRTYLPSGSLWF